MEKRKKVIAFDFDGVIASYDGWKGFDVFGEPKYGVIQIMEKLKDEGYKIIIWTTRPFTEAMREWLRINKVPYDSVNRTDHNPPMTSTKPIFHAFIDDRGIGFRNMTPNELYEEIHKLVDDIKE